MQYSGQRSFHTHPNAQYIDEKNFFIELWFYTCITENFVIFSIQEKDSPSSQDGTDDMAHFSVGVQGDGYFYIEIRLVDNEEIITIKEKTTTLQVEEGWNYIAIDIDEIYEFSYLNMYHRSELTTTANSNTGDYYDQYESFFKGYYYETFETTEPGTENMIVFGCKDYVDYSSSVIPPENTVYGLCMRGWIQHFQLYTHVNQVWTNTAAKIAFIKASMNCVGNTFCNSRTTPDVIFSNIVISDTQIFLYDTSVSSLVRNAVQTPASTFYSCSVDLSTTKTYNPFYQPSIGRITFNMTQYFSCTLTLTNPNTKVSFFPAMFTMEAWFRMDPIDLRPNGYISQVFAVYDSDNNEKDYRLGFAVSNTFLRIYLDDTIHDIHYLFNETTDYWHYVAVSYARVFERETRIYVYLDNIMILESKIFDWFIFSPQSNRYQIHIAKDFPGVVRKTKINARPFCLNSVSLGVITNNANCNQKGDTKCNFCDIAEPDGTGKYNCFPICNDFGYYIDGTGKCQECNLGCRYCKDSSLINNCYLCNKTEYFVYDYSKSNGTDAIATRKNGQTITCNCSAGTIEIGGSCVKCDSRCAVCTNILNIGCDMCSNGNYKINKDKCQSNCPDNYIKDDTNKICNFDQRLLKTPELPKEPQGCIDGYFWDWEKMKCLRCNSNCYTCEFSSDHCTSCPVGKYMTLDYDCQNCETLYKKDMIVGTNGMCIETCGDGKDYKLNQCDDGNVKNKDGCSSKCKIEPNYMCYETKTGNSKDQCSYIPTELVGAYTNRHNDIVLNFSRPINFTKGYITNKDLKLTRKNSQGDTVEVDYEALTYNLPANYIYLKVNLDEDIIGSAYLDHLVKIEYRNSEGIVDNNSKEVKQNTYARVWLSPFNYFSESEKKPGEIYGRLCLGFIFGCISFWITISINLNKSIMPIVFIVLAFQQFFYMSCQDLFLDQKAKYFFSFFRIFRFEHEKLKNFFLDDGWVDIESLTKLIYNQNIFQQGQFQYHNIHINNSFKIYFIYAYFFVMPFVLCLDFIMTQCMNVKWFERFHEKVAAKFFFSGPLMLFIILGYPLGFPVFLEIRFMTLNNDFQFYSFVVCVMISGIFFLIWMNTWLTVILQNRKSKHPLVIKRFNYIFQAVKNESAVQKIFMPLFLTRRLGSFNLVTATTLEIMLGAVYMEQLGYIEDGGPDKSTYSNIQQKVYKNIVWIIIGTTIGAIILISLTMLVFGWFKMSNYFFFKRFGYKKKIPIKFGKLKQASKSPMTTQEFIFSKKINNMDHHGDFDITKMDAEIIDVNFANEILFILQTLQNQSQSDMQTVITGHQDTNESVKNNDIDQSGAPLFKLSELKKLRQTERERYKTALTKLGQEKQAKVMKLRKPIKLADSEQQLDKEIGIMQFASNYEEKKILPTKKARKRKILQKKRIPEFAEDCLDDFKTPGLPQSSKDNIPDLDDDQHMELPGIMMSSQESKALPSFGGRNNNESKYDEFL